MVDVELLTLDEQLTCIEGNNCLHEWSFVDTTLAALDYPTVFTHVHADNIILNQSSAYPNISLTSIPNITYPKIVESDLTNAVLDSIIRGTNEHGTNDPSYDHIPVNETGRILIKLFIACLIMHGILKCWIGKMWENSSSKLVWWLTRRITASF